MYKKHTIIHTNRKSTAGLCAALQKLLLFTDEKYPKSFVFCFFLTDFPEIYSMNSPDKSRPLRNVQRNAEIKSGVHMHNSTFGLVAPQKLRL